MSTDNWIKHEGKEPPALAPAALVEIKEGSYMECRLVSDDGWYDGLEYRPLTDPEGTPYCSAEGLEPWCKYVAASYGWWGHQYQNKPKPDDEGEWWVTRGRMGPLAPGTHIHPGRWLHSLMRVWRE